MSLPDFVRNTAAWLHSPDNPWFDRHFVIMVLGVVTLGLLVWEIWESYEESAVVPTQPASRPLPARKTAGDLRPRNYRGPRRPGDHASQRAATRTREMQPH